mgnify:CR=1 FL=1
MSYGKYNTAEDYVGAYLVTYTQFRGGDTPKKVKIPKLKNFKNLWFFQTGSLYILTLLSQNLAIYFSFYSFIVILAIFVEYLIPVSKVHPWK